MPTSTLKSERLNLLRLNFAVLGAVMDEAGLRGDFAAAMAQAGVPGEPLAEGCGGLTFANYLQVLQTLSGKCPGLGIRLAARKTSRAYGVFGIGMITAGDLAQSFRILPMLARVLWDRKVRFMSRLDSGWASIHFESTWPQGSPLAGIALADLFLGAIRIIAEVLPGADWSACELRMRGAAPAEAHLYAECFPCPCRFDQAEDKLLMPAAWLSQALPLANGTVAEYCEELCRELAEDANQVLQVRQKVRACLNAMEASHYPTLQEMAEMMRVSERSLRKGLARESASFRDIVQSYKVELAQKYLAETRIPIKEIAFRLGFAQVPSFYRAFGRVDARTPDQFRIEMRLNN